MHRADQRLGARGGHERRALADEQRIVEEPAQPAERVAHARLAEPDALRRPRDAALAEQGVERDEQVEVEAAEVHSSVNLAYHKIQLAHGGRRV